MDKRKEIKVESNYNILKNSYPRIYKEISEIGVYDKKYELLITKDGAYTLKINQKDNFYLHSKYNPLREAKNFIDENYDIEIRNYIVIGLGFVYHINELLKRDVKNISIIITNLDIFKLAIENIDLSDILRSSKVKIYLGNTPSLFKDAFLEASKLESNKLILHKTSIKAMDDDMEEIRYLLEEFKVKELSTKNINYDLEGNFEFNKVNYDEVVNKLFNKFNNKPIFLVSAGPSLDKNKHLLKDIGDKGIILCVGRAVRVLLKEGVTPDFIIITDSSEDLYNSQLKGLDIEVPIIVLSTCDKNVMKYYKGKKYIAFQNGFDKAEKLAKKLSIETIETGGSVATTGPDIAIRMGCNPIVFVGQDLAFSKGQTHSKDTYSKEVNHISILRKIKDIEGNDIYTSKNLSIYLRWIENRIREEKDITFIDATEGGARIIGTKVINLIDVLENRL